MAILAAVLSHFESNSQNPKKFQKNSKKIPKKFNFGSKNSKMAQKHKNGTKSGCDSKFEDF